MLRHVIAFSLKHRMLVLLAALVAAVCGGYQLWPRRQMPVDVFPDLNRPTVTVLTEAPGLAPEEVEALVTRPLEYLLNGATGVRRVRSSSGVGLSVVWVEFEWGSDIYRDRQTVSEKLQLARERLPESANPVMAPISSIMGEVLLLAVRSNVDPKTPEERAGEARELALLAASAVGDGAAGPRPALATSARSDDAKKRHERLAERRRDDKAMELRTLAEFTLRNRLLAVEGVSQVTVMGGIRKQYQVVTSPARLAAAGVTLDQLREAAEKANLLAGGSVLVRPPKESVIRIDAQSLTLQDLEECPVVWRFPRAVRVKDVADVRFGGPVRRGDGSVLLKEGTTVAGGPAVVLTVQKQPNADTLTLDREIDGALARLQQELPDDVRIERQIFKQADFIQAAVDNVAGAVLDGGLWVVVVLFVFLWNFRVSVASLTAMPLSILLTVLAFRWFGVSINTMTLGGIAVAIGDLVDDSIVDIENIYRRLKENRHKPHPEPALKVIYDASCEVRGSIVYATLIVILVVFPLFALAGLEGRMFAPLAVAYITSLLASLLVSLTVTPVLGSYLLPRARFLEKRGDPLALRGLKWLFGHAVRFSLRHATVVLVAVAVLVGLALLAVSGMGGEFLPPFNEGTLTVNVQARPGTSLDESDRVARRAEALILAVPEVRSVARRTGRAELDEHAEGVNSSELDVRLVEHERPRPGWGYWLLRRVPLLDRLGTEYQGRPREAVVADLRDRLANLPDVKVNVGQPISHRLDHVLSGVRAQVAVKVFGPDLRVLNEAAGDVEARMSRIPGVVDLQVEPQVPVPQLRLKIRRKEAATHGLAPGDVARLLETAYRGRVVSQVIDGERFFDLVVWYEESARGDPDVISQTILNTPSGRRVALAEVAEVAETYGPNALNRENVERRTVVLCNVQGRALGSVVADIKRELAPVEEKLRGLRGGYRVEYGGQHEAQQEASWRIGLLYVAVVLPGVFLLLCMCLESWRAALQVMVNVPLALVGAVAALLIVNWPGWDRLQAAPWWDWPGVWVQACSLSVAHLVGFITLTGVVSRNGIMMISHYLHLMRHEGEQFTEQMIVRGTLERLAPVMMTAFTSFVGLLPLLSGAGQTGKEILYPLAVVVFGGMVASTLLDQVVTPALFFKFGRKVYAQPPRPAGRDQNGEGWAPPTVPAAPDSFVKANAAAD